MHRQQSAKIRQKGRSCLGGGNFANVIARERREVDTRATEMHCQPMAVLRQIAIFLLVLAVLPWGAYSGGLAPTQMVKPDSHVAAYAEPLKHGTNVSSDTQTGPFLATVTKRCRTAALFGSACGPDLALPLTTVTGGNPMKGKDVFRKSVVWPLTVEPSVPLAPPRLC